MDVCLVRYNEIALKGANLNIFENLLIKHIKEYLIQNNIKFDNIRKTHKQILIYTGHKCDFLRFVFGIASFSYAVETDLDIDKIKKAVLDVVNDKNFKKFRVSTKRSNKLFLYNSLQINSLVGDLIKNRFKKNVDLKNFDLDVSIAILDLAYIYVDKTQGPGGLPLGIEGKAVSLIEDNKSLLASCLLMKRGCKVIPVSYNQFDIKLLKKFDYSLKLTIVKSIKEIEGIAEKNNAKALISGQILNGFEEIKTKLVILRPLMGLNEKEIEDKLKDLENL